MFVGMRARGSPGATVNANIWFEVTRLRIQCAGTTPVRGLSCVHGLCFEGAVVILFSSWRGPSTTSSHHD